MRFYLRQLTLVALLAGTPGVAVAADDGWQAQVGAALGKPARRRRAASTGSAYRAPISKSRSTASS
jgi:hypothetical protein